jgi:hypothetical protein
MQLEELLLLAPGGPCNTSTIGQSASPPLSGDSAEQAELAALSQLQDGLACDLFASLQHEHCAPRVAAVAFCSALADRAGLRHPKHFPTASPEEPEPGATTGEADGSATAAMRVGEEEEEARRAGWVLLQHMLAVVRRERASESYVKGDAVHRIKLRAWQAVCVLAPFMPESKRTETLQLLLGVLHRFDLASVKQYQERGVLVNLELFGLQSVLRSPPLHLLG